MHQYLEPGCVKFGFDFVRAKLMRIAGIVLAELNVLPAAILVLGVFVGAFVFGCFVVIRKSSEGLLRHLRSFDQR